MRSEQYLKQIPLRKRGGDIVAWTLVDEEDFAELNRWTWSLRVGYASRCGPRGSRPATIGMHRQILGLTAGDGLEADHINGDRLDNRRTNLRAVKPGENKQNRPAQRGTSRHRGVCWNTQRKQWMAYGHADNRTFNLGYFDSEDEAARTSAAWRQEHLPFSADQFRKVPT